MLNNHIVSSDEIDNSLLSEDFEQFRGTTLDITRKIKKAERERNELLSKLMVTSYLPEVDVDLLSSDSSSSSGNVTDTFTSSTMTITQPKVTSRLSETTIKSIDSL